MGDAPRFQDEPRKYSPFVEIGNREIYDTLTDVSIRLRTVEQTLTATLKDNSDIKKDYSARLRTLELRSYTVLAGCISMVAILLKSGGVAGL